MMSFNFAPKSWALCNVQILPIQQYQALFSLLGTTYGGNGTTTFALPNLQGCVPLGFGTAPGGSYNLGETAGETSHTLLLTEIPLHNHGMMAKAGPAELNAAGVKPAPAVTLGEGAAAQGSSSPVTATLYGTAAATGSMAPNALALEGGSQPHANQQPYQVINFCIALSGIFPSRN
jgi:microcystin-dependent protein